MSTDLRLEQVQPWGASLRAVTVGRAHTVLQAPDGGLWDSLRDAFWGQALDMCMCEDQTDQLELMRATLRCVAEDMHRIDPDTMVSELFAGSTLFFRHYLLHLSHLELVEHQVTPFKHGRLSSFGWSALAMLEATKPVIVDATDAAHARASAIQRGENRVLTA